MMMMMNLNLIIIIIIVIVAEVVGQSIAICEWNSNDTKCLPMAIVRRENKSMTEEKAPSARKSNAFSLFLKQHTTIDVQSEKF